MVSDHAAEPASLVSHVSSRRCRVIADVHGRRDAEPDRQRVAAGCCSGLPNSRDHPLGYVEVCKLQDEAVADLPGELERERAVGGDPDLEF